MVTITGLRCLVNVAGGGVAIRDGGPHRLGRRRRSGVVVSRGPPGLRYEADIEPTCCSLLD